MKKLLFIFALAFTAGLQAQTIEFTINSKDTTVYLARYFGQKLYYADTAEVKNGKFSFDDSKHKGGLYALLLPNGKPFEFILDNEDVQINIKDMNDAIGTAEVVKSPNNKAFINYMRFTNKSRAKTQELIKIIKSTEKGSPEREKAEKEYKKINEEVRAYQDKLIAENGDRFVAVMIKMTLEPELPDHPRDAEGNITDSNYVFQYFEKHFWDNVPLKDPRVVNTPVFHTRLDRYFSRKGVLQAPDTIFFYARHLLDKTDQVDQDNEVFHYIVHHVTNKYESSEIMGMDKVFYYMAQNYYCAPNDKAYWIDSETQEKICTRARTLGRTLIGNTAIPIILPDSTEKKWINSHSIDADYTVLYFWDPNCGHCKKVTPKLQTLYEKKLKGRNIEVFAVAKATNEEDFKKWKKFIRDNKLTYINVGLTASVYEQATTDPTPLLNGRTTIQSLNYADTYDIYSTPRIFILDKDKRIMYKQISIGLLEEILDKETGHEDDEKLFPKEDPENSDTPETH